MVLRIRRRCNVRGRVVHTDGVVIPHSLVSTFFDRVKTAVLYSEQQQQRRQEQQQQQQRQQEHHQQQPTTENVTDMHDTEPVNITRILRRSTRHRRQPARLAYSNPAPINSS